METKEQQTSESPTLENQNEAKSELTGEQVGELMEQTRNMKKALKQLSKKQLIQLLLQQVDFAVEQQNINKVLHARLRAQATGEDDAT